MARTLGRDLRLREVADILGCCHENLRRLARKKKLIGAYKIGGRWRLRSEALALLRGTEESMGIQIGGRAHE